MILDAQLMFSDAQALAAPGVSTNLLDVRSLNLSGGEPMALVISVDVAPDAGNGDETYTAQLQTDDAAAFSSPANLGGAFPIPRNTLVGTRFVIPLPYPFGLAERYLRISYTLGGTTPSITLSAYLSPRYMAPGASENVFYADAIQIG